MSKKKKTADAAMRKRESGFDIISIPHATLPEYSALHDPNMRHYFENPKVQRLLYETGQIDKHGRVIDLNRNKAKLNILEREFAKAEEAEASRVKEEEEMRVSNGIFYLLHAICYFVVILFQAMHVSEIKKTCS
jgi:hypothetical protein